MEKSNDVRNTCCECGHTWLDSQGQRAAHYKEGCPMCGHLYWNSVDVPDLVIEPATGPLIEPAPIESGPFDPDAGAPMKSVTRAELTEMYGEPHD